MVKIMFVCHGNICRSPMAEFVMKKMAADAGVSGELEIASAATTTEEIWNGVGNPVYPPAKKVLAEHGIFCGDKRARLLKRSDYGQWDLFIGMDEENRRDMRRILGGDPDGKIHLLMDYTSRMGEVADPWYTRNFERTYRDVEEGCRGLLEFLAGKA